MTSRRGRAEALTPPRAASRVTVGAMTAMTASRDRAGDDAVPAVDVDYARLMALLRSPHSASLRDRHAAAVDRVCRAHDARGGIPLRELDDMEQVVRFVYDAVADGHAEAFEQTLCALMRLYAKPFVERAASDAGRHVDAVVRALALVSECLALQGAPASAAVAASDAIRAFASPRGDRAEKHSPSGEAAARDTRERRALACAAGCAPACLRSLSAADARAKGSVTPGGEDDAVVLTVSLLRTLTELSRDAACAARMASAGALDRLTPTFGRDFRDRRVFVGAELLWNVLEAISRDVAASKSDETESVALPSEKFFAAFADALARATRDAHGDADKDLRNELFVAAHLLAERGGAWRARFRETRVIVDVAVAASTIPEWHDAHASKRVHPSACASPARPRDFEMKRLAWTLVAELAADEAGAEETLGEDGGVFVAALLAHLAPLAGFPDHAGARGAAEAIERRWSDAQRADLQTLALRCLARLAPVTMDALAAAGAVETAIAAAADERCASHDAPDERRAAALAFLERAARSGAALAARIGGSAVAVEAALRALDPGRAVSQFPRGGGVGEGEGGGGSGEEERNFFRSLDARSRGTLRGGRVTLAPGATAFSEIRPRVADDPASLAACALLAALCDGDPRNFRALRRAGGVLVLLRATQGLVATDAAVPIAFGAATVRAVWRCVVPDAKNRAVFVAEGGVGALLDAACRCHAALRPVILSALADILENPKTHLFFHEWRSTAPRAALAPAGAQAVTLVLNLWRVEARRDGAESSRDVQTGEPGAPGALASLEDSGLNTAYVHVRRARADADARALAAAARAGRHAGEGDAARAAAAESTRARVFAVCSLLGFEHLRRTCSRADAATLAAVERYVDLREGETWARTERIFAEEGTFPVGPDRAAMDAALDAAAESRRALAAAVSAYDAEARAEAAAAEAAAHDEARERWEAEEAARWYRGDKTKLTMRERLANGVKHEAMLRSSFKGLSASGRFSEIEASVASRADVADRAAA